MNDIFLHGVVAMIQALVRQGSGSQVGLGEHVAHRRRSKNVSSNGNVVADQADVQADGGMIGAEMC